MIISEDVRRYSMKLRSFSERIGGYEGPFAVHPHALLSLPLLSDYPGERRGGGGVGFGELRPKEL